MPSDRFKRKEIKTLRQRWIMKHKDRADDIPNCPSIENIVNMPTPNEIPPTDKVATDNTVDDSPIAKIPNDSKESEETSSQQEILSKPTTTDETFTIPIKSVRRHRGQRKRRSQRSRKYRKRNMTSSDSSSGFAIRGRASERRDDIPMCPDIENICQLQSELDDDMSVHVHRFSHALYQLFDDFFLLLTNLVQFLKDHPRPATIASFIAASYLIICYLELSIAALIELIAQSIWPISHAVLLFTERLSINFGSFMHSSDDIIKGAYCDVAEIWCKNFQMMCADRCSFFSMAVERLRTN